MRSSFEEKKANAPEDAPLGAVGYLFRKNFPDYGFFEGIVTQIRVGAVGGKDRRCLYSDGDEEDLSLEELRALPRSYATKNSKNDGKAKKRKLNSNETPCHMTKKIKEGLNGESVEAEVKSKKNTKISVTSVKKQAGQKSNNRALSTSIFSSVGELVPIDKAAEATLKQPQIHSNERLCDHGNDSDVEKDIWLEKMALLLGAEARSKLQPAKPPKNTLPPGKSHRSVTAPMNSKRVSSLNSESSSTLSTNIANDSNSICSSLSNRSNTQTSTAPSFCPMTSVKISRTASESSSICGDAFFSLSDITPGNRHGAKVFHMKDRKRRIGEILLEHPGGWVEANINGSIKKSRASTFVVVPDHFNIGDMANTSVSLQDHDGKGTSDLTYKSKHTSEQQDDKVKSAPKNSNISPEQNSSPQPESYQKQSRQGNKKSPKCSSNLGKSSSMKPNHHNSDTSLPLETLFYWCCDRCTMVNSSERIKCDACGTRIRNKTIRSALLQIAEDAVGLEIKSVKKALECIPPIHQPAIPEAIIRKLVALKWPKIIQPKDSPPEPSRKIESYFYWICGFCTMKNLFKKSKCGTCCQRRKQSVSSALLKIAEKAAREARTTSECIQFIPFEHRPAIPESVIASLITCIFIIGKRTNNQRRCLRPKAPGVDYCAFHCDPLLITPCITKEESVEERALDDQNPLNMNDVSSSNVLSSPDHSKIPSKERSTKSSNSEKGVLTIMSSLPKFLSQRLDTSHSNILNWKVNCIEDAILCEENNPFPLGLLVRRFFPRYGFHDGRIIKLRRRQIFDQKKGTDRPVLVYRVLYNDGDEEDFMHHEINSLMQIYDRRNIDSRAAPSLQIIPGTLYETQQNGIVKIVKHTTALGAATRGEGGIVHMEFCQLGHPWTDLVLELTKLQLSIVRKLQYGESSVSCPAGKMGCTNEISSVCLKVSSQDSESNYHTTPSSQTLLVNTSEKSPSYATISPVLEWPSSQRLKSADDEETLDKESAVKSGDTDKEEYKVCSNLSLRLESFEETVDEFDNHSSFPTFKNNKNSCIVDDPIHMRNCSFQSQSGWDPANASNYISWDPYGTTTCEICRQDKDDHQILICDECHRGYHMYCVRPVIVNVPTSDWLCSDCSTDRDDENFDEFMETIQNDPSSLSKFLSLPFDSPDQFVSNHKYELELFSPSTHAAKRQAIIGSNRSIATVNVGSLYFSKNVNKGDWVLPLPLSSNSLYSSSLASIVAAMKYCGMASYSEELVYPVEYGATKEMNDASLNTTRIDPLSQRNLGIFKDFLHNQRKGCFPPIKVVHDEKIGFSVEALAAIPRHTLIAEYVGEVITAERSGETSSDSLMMLLDTGSPKTSLIIDPTRAGNFARFLSGINNRCCASRRKANVRTRRFVMDGKCRVALFTSKKIEAGDKLNYDYNAGVEGKTVEEWANTGFYDTSNFY